MNNFHDILLPSFINNCLVGGPSFQTRIVTAVSGREQRLAVASQAMYQYHIADCQLSRAELEQFSAFFHNCQGAAFGFLLKDWGDYNVSGQTLELDDQQQQFWLYKNYVYGQRVYKRRILKPIVESVKISLDDYLVDFDTSEDGVVLLSKPLARGQVLQISFEFNVPVRFCNDSFSYSLISDGSIKLAPMELKELCF
jgi:uncharacterized protein (TIGR02217 family)